MEVYRIDLKENSSELKASGLENRWNFEGQEVIYTADTRSLACVESLLHSSGEFSYQDYEIMVINIPDDLQIEHLNIDLLPPKWNLPTRPILCQTLGSEWIVSGRSVVLKVPSAIVKNEYNYIINVNHPDFIKVKHIANEPFFI